MVKFYEEIVEERRRQRQKWGTQVHSLWTWFLIELEEIGEVANALLETRLYKNGRLGKDHVRKEVVQVVTVALAFVQEYRPWHGVWGIK